MEWGALILKVDTCPTCAKRKRATITITLPPDHVFEDIAPRLADLDLDGTPEVIVVESDLRLGAALAIYDETGKITETPHYGQPYRWLAPIGAADLDGDGRVELAYIDRPHLAKTLRIWRFENNRLKPLADLPGLTNHRIGQDYISGGIRTCAAPPRNHHRQRRLDPADRQHPDKRSDNPPRYRPKHRPKQLHHRPDLPLTPNFFLS